MVSKNKPAVTATSPRMTLTRAKKIVEDFGDRKLLAPRVRHMLAYTGFSTAEIAGKIFELYASEGVKVPAGFGDTSMETAMMVAREYESATAVVGKGFTTAEETEIFTALVCIARAQVKDGGSKPGVIATLAKAGKARSRTTALGVIVNAEIAVGDAMRERRRGTGVVETIVDTAEGRASLAKRDESAKQAQIGETKAERKARTAGDKRESEAERKATEGGDKGSGPVTPRTPESGPDPLAGSVETGQHMPPASVSKSAPAKQKTLVEATTPDLIRALRGRLSAGLKITTTLDEMFEVLAREWSERALETPMSATPERERKATAERAAKVAANVKGKRVRKSEPTPEPSGRVGIATVPTVKGEPADVVRARQASENDAARKAREAAATGGTAIAQAFADAQAKASA